jgi:hypothetical protein
MGSETATRAMSCIESTQVSRTRLVAPFWEDTKHRKLLVQIQLCSVPEHVAAWPD